MCFCLARVIVIGTRDYLNHLIIIFSTLDIKVCKKIIHMVLHMTYFFYQYNYNMFCHPYFVGFFSLQA